MEQITYLENQLKLAEKNYLDLKNEFDSRLEQARRELFERIEKISQVIDWEADLGEMRELKEVEWQALKKEFGCV